MRSVLIGLGLVLLLLAAVPVALLATGTIDVSSLRMILNVATGLTGPAADRGTVARHLQVPPGFSVQLYAADLPRARFLRVTAAGDLLVSRPHAGDIVLLRRDADGDGAPDARETLLEGLRRPLGLDLADGWLYIAESNRIGRIAFDAARGTTSGSYQPFIEGLTDNGNHWSKTLRVGPDGDLYLAQGSTCNVCAEDDPRRATLMRFPAAGDPAAGAPAAGAPAAGAPAAGVPAAGGDGEVIATGLRNAVGFDWAPWDGALYATDNGRDLLGDDFPPCELNHITAGGFYGWPYFNGDNVPDPDMGADPEAATRSPTPPAFAFRAHNAPLGITFLRPLGRLPEDYRRSALVALHGSWNRSSPDGYKVVSLHWTEQGIVERDFLRGFLRDDGEISGRPVDVAQGPDGAIYVSDDYAGAIYRVSYGEAAPAGATAALAPPPQSAASPPGWLADADLEAMAAAGATLYAAHQCAECHDVGASPKRLDPLAARRDYGAVLAALEAPQPPMPALPLTLQERRALAVYVVHRATPP